MAWLREMHSSCVHLDNVGDNITCTGTFGPLLFFSTRNTPSESTHWLLCWREGAASCRRICLRMLLFVSVFEQMGHAILLPFKVTLSYTSGVFVPRSLVSTIVFFGHGIWDFSGVWGVDFFGERHTDSDETSLKECVRFMRELSLSTSKILGL